MSTYRVPSLSLPWLALLGAPGVLLAGLLMGVPANAQCSSQWAPGQGVPGVAGSVYAMTMWDRDGGGPLPPVLVVGGSFAFAGNAVANSIATHDPATGTWSPLGSG